MRHWINVVLEECVDKDGIPDNVWKSLSRASKIISDSDDYSFRTSEAEALFDETQVAGSIQDLSHLVYQIALHFGFHHGTLFLIRAGAKGGLWSHRVCTSLPETWLRHYKENNYQYIDPAILHSITSGEPEFVNCNADDAPLVKTFWDDAKRHAIGTTVYCGSHKTRNGAVVGFSFLSKNSVLACKKKIRLDESDIFFITQSLAEIFEELSATGSGNVEALSEQELIFLRSALLGRPVNEPMDYGGFRVCPKSVQAAIRRKLGVDTILQAIAIAASRGWLDETPYTNGEVHTIFENLPKIEDFKLHENGVERLKNFAV